ncbi:MAG: tetratricopeptide repeat protein [Acidobacteria bacterium]|nr:tetratricopeptide repeat protein [Acidobacteriota bacterium]
MNISKSLLLRSSVVVLTAAALYVPVQRYRRKNPAVAPHAQPAKPATQDIAKTNEHEIKVLQAQLDKKPGHAPVLLRMAELAREAGKPAEAAKHLREALQSEPDLLDARLELGRALFDAGDPRGAIQETSAILRSHPKDTDALYNLGAIHANLGDFPNAVKFWQEAVSADPQSESGRRAKESLAQITKPAQVSGPNPHANGLPAGHPTAGVDADVHDFIRSVAARSR